MSNFGTFGNQVDVFVSNVAKALGFGRKEVEPGGPLVPFRTALQLTAEQEERLVAHAVARLEDLKTELGSGELSGGVNFTTPGWLEGLPFMERRRRYEDYYHNRVGWRASVKGSVFEKSNLVVPIVRRVTRQMVARAVGYFFATDPWFAAYPHRGSSVDFAERLQQWARYKTDECGLKQALIEAIELAFVRGEAVVKTRHVVNEQIYKSFSVVLVDAQGKFVLDASGDYIFATDAWVPEMEEVVDVAAAPTEVPVPQMRETGRMVLKKDGVTVMPAAPIWEERRITRRMVTENGPEVRPVYFRDFYCPLNAESVDKADAVFHVMDLPAMQVASLRGRRNVTQSADAALEDLQGVVKVLDEVASISREPMAKRGDRQNDMESGTGNTNSGEELLHLAEGWLRFDVDGDGIEEEVMVLFDTVSKQAIFYDYTANLVPKGQRPFRVIRVNYVDGRWYGIGAMEMFFSSQEFVDLVVNRINFSQGGSGRVTFWKPSLTVEGQANPNLRLNDGATYTLRADVEAKDALSYVTLPEVKGADLFQLLNYFSQVVQLESGVVNAGDQEHAGLPAAKLATGIRNIERSGQEMFGLFLQQLEGGTQSVLDAVLLLLAAHMDEKEIYEYFGGPDGERLFGEISREEVANVAIKTRLLLTRYRGEQQLMQNQQAVAFTREFYAQLPLVQRQTFGLYRQLLRSLEVRDVDRVIVPVDVPLPDGRAPSGPNVETARGAIDAKPQGQAEPNL
ncbi:hypothetical protein Ga0100231_004990 [Opitutaceae bacterium TAV4]|nr:hypothetical protein Ga0100231_004990 [Opitutaceae bacterium TAV4]RRK02351.1 hypothetical protein Ga0100230_004135 [Opitutaceae bacterium TAV3]